MLHRLSCQEKRFFKRFCVKLTYMIVYKSFPCRMKCLVFTLWLLPVTISLNGPLMPLYKPKLLFAPIPAMESHKMSSVKFLSHLPETSSRLIRHQINPVTMSGPSAWFTDHRRGMITTMIKEYISELGPPVTVPIGKFRKNNFCHSFQNSNNVFDCGYE